MDGTLFLDHHDSVRHVMLHLSAADVDACRGTCRAWRKLGSEDHLWRRLAAISFWSDCPDDQPELALAPIGGGMASGPDGGGDFLPSSTVEAAPDWRVAFCRWASLSHYVDGGRGTDASLWIRIAGAWATIERALREKIPAIEATLNMPTTPDRLAHIRSRALRYVYAVHDGQQLAIDRCMLSQDAAGVRANLSSLWHGLFGGYSAYSHLVCMRMHPSTVAAEIAAKIGPTVFRLPAATGERAVGPAETDDDSRLELLSTSYRIDRCFAVDARDAVHVRGCAGDWQVATPSLAGWFCEYARRLSCGYYRVGPLSGPDGDRTLGILLFPDVVDGDWCTRAVTQGIEVVASAVYMPEHPQAFAYSLRIAMLKGGAHGSAQLFRRTWTITDGRGEPRVVTGEGVVGKFPLLRAGGGYRDDEQASASVAAGPSFSRAVPPGREVPSRFVYQSFSGPMESPEGGRFGGGILFYPGSVSEPAGEPFVVAVAPFRLARPALLY
jgi:uncharacterized protein affecting Mg2+/Co2+ transport